MRKVTTVPSSGDLLEMTIWCSFLRTSREVGGGELGREETGGGLEEQTDAAWRGKMNHTKCFFIARTLPQRPRCYPELLRVKKGSVSKDSAAAGRPELIQL